MKDFQFYLPPVLKNNLASHKVSIRIIIEKRRQISDTPGKQGVFIMEGLGYSKLTTSTSISGSPDTSSISLALDTLVYSQKYTGERFNIPSRDMKDGKTYLYDTKNNKFEVDLDKPSVLDKVPLKPLSEFASLLESNDLVYADAWSWRLGKMLPIFTGTIVNKRFMESLQDTRYIQLECSDLLYFLNQSKYISAPGVFSQSYNESVGVQPDQAPDLAPYNTNLMGLSGFEVFLKVLLTNGKSEDLEKYLDKEGRLTSLSDDFPTRAPILSRVERILAYPYSIAMGSKWQLVQSENKNKLDHLKELASALEVEFFQSEAGEVVFKFPTRIDGFSLPNQPAINLLPRNNFGRSKANSPEAKIINKYLVLIARQKSYGGAAKLGVIKDAEIFKLKNTANDPDYIYVDLKSELLKKDKLRGEVLKGGEVPVIYQDELAGQTLEENSEAIITAGCIKTDQHFVMNNMNTEDAIMLEKGVFFRDVVGSAKYGIRLQEFNPLWLRDVKYLDLYAWTKMSVINQERLRASFSVKDDPFIRKGHTVKLDHLRKLKVLRLYPKQPTHVVTLDKEGSKVGQLERGNNLQAASLLIRDFNTPQKATKVEDIEFHEVLVNAPSVYYVESISRDYNIGEGTAMMTLDTTAGRAEYNTLRADKKSHYGEAEDQWTRGFFTFWEFFYEPPELRNTRETEQKPAPAPAPSHTTPSGAPAAPAATPSPAAPAATPSPAAPATSGGGLTTTQKTLNSYIASSLYSYNGAHSTDTYASTGKNPILLSIAAIQNHEVEDTRPTFLSKTDFTFKVNKFLGSSLFWQAIHLNVKKDSLVLSPNQLLTAIEYVYYGKQRTDIRPGLKLKAIVGYLRPDSVDLIPGEFNKIFPVFKKRLERWTLAINESYKKYFEAI